MAWTPDDEAKLNALQSMLPGYVAPESASPPDSLLKYAGKRVANILPGALNELNNTAQGLLGVPDQYRNPAPQFFDQQTPQGVGQNIVNVGAGITEALPSFLIPELGATKIASSLGAGANLAKVIGGAAGFAAPSVDEGAGVAALQGGIGAVQAGARLPGMPWQAKLAAGVIGGAAGYAASPTPETGYVNAGINALVPTIIDPLLSKVFPHQQPHVQAGEANKLPPEVAPSPSGLQLAPDQNRPLQPQPTGIPFHNAPDTSGMQLLPNAGLGGNGNIVGQVWHGPATMEPSGLQLMPEHLVGQRGAGTSQVGTLLGEAPATRVDTGTPNITLAGTFPDQIRGIAARSIPDAFPPAHEPLTLVPDVGQRRDPLMPIVKQSLKEPLAFAPEVARPSQAQAAEPVATVQTASKSPFEKLPSGLTKHLETAEGWTPEGQPLAQNFTQGAHKLGASMTTEAEVARLQKGASHFDSAFSKAMDAGDMNKASDYAMRAQYLREAHEYATGHTGKVEMFKRSNPDYTPSVPSKEYKAAADKKKVSEAPPQSEEIKIQSSRPKSKAELIATMQKHGVSVDDSGGYSIHFDAPDGYVWKANGETGMSIHYATNSQSWFSEALKQEWDGLAMGMEKETNPKRIAEIRHGLGDDTWGNKATTSVEPVPLATVQVLHPQGHWENAHVLGREDGVTQVQIKDPIFGDRIEYINDKSGRIRNAGDELMSPVMNTAGPSVRTTGSNAQSIESAIATLHPEAQALINNVVKDLTEASGQQLDLHARSMGPSTGGAAHILSGRIGLNKDIILTRFSNWAKMSETSKVKAAMDFVALLGHEITHVAQQFGEKSGLQINGKPLLQAIKDNVFGLHIDQRKKMILELSRSRGHTNERVNAYLAGDVEKVKAAYQRAGWVGLSEEKAMDLAAGEFMAELGSVELAKRAKLAWVPDPIRKALDMFKGAIVRVVAWLKGEPSMAGSKELAALQDISAKMYDHFAAADQAALSKAFPASEIWGGSGGGKYPSSSVPRAPLNVAVTPHTSAFLKGELIRLGVRGAVGATAGGLVLPGISDHQITTGEGILLGGILGAAGPAVAKAMFNKDFKAAFKEGMRDFKGNPLNAFKVLMGGELSQKLGQAGAREVGEASWAAKYTRFIESNFGVNMPELVKGISQYSKGIVQEQLQILGKAFDAARRFEPNADMLNATEEYYTGKLSKEGFIAMLQTDSLKQYGNFVLTARSALSTVTGILSEGLPKSSFKTAVLNNTESYLGRFYAAFKEGKFNTDAYVKARSELMQRYPHYTLEIADNIMHDYQAEILANRKMFSKGNNNAQAINPELYKRRLATEEEIRTQQEIVGGIEHNPESPTYKAEKAKLDWMMEHPLTDGWRDWLGEYKNPNERVMMSFMKVYPSSIAAKMVSFFDSHLTDKATEVRFREVTNKLAAGVTDPVELAALQKEKAQIQADSLKFAYTDSEFNAKVTELQGRIAKEQDPQKLATMQSQLNQVSSYMPLGENSAYGKLSGKYVDRFVRDELSTYNSPYQWMQQPVMRGISSFNNMVKVSRTALNPLTMIRNYVQLPIFTLMSGTKFKDWGAAWNTIHNNANPELLSAMRRNHIIGADFVTSELGKGPGTYFDGYYDSDVATRAAKTGLEGMLKAYQVPDTIHRAATFISSLTKIAEKEGISINEALRNSDLVDRATHYTERYTMNYSAVPRIVKAARQLPFISLFVSYTSEITKVLKNLTMDIIHNDPSGMGRFRAAAVLGSMVAIPAMLTAAAKGALSPADLIAWEKLEQQSPDYLRGRFRIPTERRKDGSFKYIDMTNLLPADNYSQMVKAALNGDVAAALAANPIASLQDTPLLNIASEQITGQDIRTGQKFSGLMGRANEVLKEVLPPILPPGYEGSRLQKAFSVNDKGEYGTQNLRTGVQVTPSDIVFNYLTSMRLGNVSPSAVSSQFVRETQDKIKEQQSLARRVLASDANQQDKQYAAEHLRMTTAEILKEMTSKL